MRRLLIGVLFLLFFVYDSTANPNLDPTPNSSCPMVPRQLVSRPTDGTAEWNEEVAQWLGTLKGPYMIHAATGGFRGIKSFFQTFAMYRSMKAGWPGGECSAQFTIGDGPSGVTRGIWVAAVPFKDGTLILLDCEGLFDPRTPHEVSQQLFSFVAGFATSLGLHTWRSIDSDLLSFLAIQGTLSRFSSMRLADQVGTPPILNLFIADGTLYDAVPNCARPTDSRDITNEFEKMLDTCSAGFKETCREIRQLFSDRRAFAAHRASQCELDFLRQLSTLPCRNRGGGIDTRGEPDAVSCVGCPDRPFLSSLERIVDVIIGRVPIKTLGGVALLNGRQLADAARSYWQAAATGVFSDSPVFNLDQFRAAFCLRTLEAADDACLITNDAMAGEVDIRERESRACMRLEVARQVDGFAKLSDEWVEQCIQQSDAMVAEYYQAIREQKFEWVRGEWSSCSGSCPGERSAEVFCQRGDGLRVADQHCASNGSEKPSTITQDGCSNWSYAWKTQPGTCNPGCPGRRSVAISCVRCDDVKQLTDAPCLQAAVVTGPKPEREEECENPLKSWEAGDFQTDCPGSCGSGTQTRDVKCVGCADVQGWKRELPVAECNGLQKPDTTRSCQLPACPTPTPAPASQPKEKIWKKIRKVIRWPF